MTDQRELYWNGRHIGRFEPEFSDFPRCLGTWHPADTDSASDFLRAIRADEAGTSGVIPTVSLDEPSSVGFLVDRLDREPGDRPGGGVVGRWVMVLSPAPPGL